jgi:hypothetical protein
LATAKTVLDVEKTQASWIKIEDDAAAVWTYIDKGEAKDAKEVHVNMDPMQGRVLLARKPDGSAILRHDGPGLPRRIIVNWSSPPTAGAGLAVLSYWSGLHKFDQEGWLPKSRAELMDALADFARDHGKKPSKIHLPAESERRLDAERKAELKGDKCEEPDYRKAFPRLDDLPVVWDANEFKLEE